MRLEFHVAVNNEKNGDTKISFLEWLDEQSDRDDPIGDLSKDVKRDKRSSNVPNDKDSWIEHLKLAGACLDVIEALEEAWDEYES
uniref:YozE SAM-like fold n=1 Tax=Candidatus Kentrum sp. LPFa TaxID=2126335 RepID=A0A450X1A0_9GAMM|nr:MAG: YozE SAM-like fold [Candidatus Kentron sp. LPFa]